MPYFVYIIQSISTGKFYKGFSEDPKKRLTQHNSGETASTKHAAPWRLVYVEAMNSKSDAIIRERNLKKATRERIIALIDHPKNIVKHFTEPT